MLKWVAAAAAVLVVAVGLAAFEPWRAFTSSTLDEAAPTGAAADDPTPTAPAPGASSPTGAATTSTPTPTPRDRVLAAGDFEDAEHATAGRVVLLELADGRRFVRLEDLAGSDGPDLHVWLSDQPSGGDWGSYDDGRYVRLGELKATHGNQNYEVSPDADLSGMRSVVIWCDRFNVAFGTAPLDRA